MTPAARMRRHRGGIPKPAMSRKALATFANKLIRYLDYLGAFQRERLIEWDDDVINGKHGKIGMAFLAEVCRLGDASAQQQVHAAIRERGAAYGRELWRALKAGA